MPLSRNEIRHRAIGFSKEWTGAKREQAEKQTFWNEFFNVFGIRRRVVASFEQPVKNLSGDYGYIDLFWPGVALVEHKSFGKDLSKAESQAFRYIQDLARLPLQTASYFLGKLRQFKIFSTVADLLYLSYIMGRDSR